MILDFNSIDEEILSQFKGGEGDTCLRRFSDDMGTVMMGRLPAGASLGLHRHEANCEVIYIISGSGCVRENDGVCRPLAAGSVHYCPKGEEHALINNSDGELRFFAVLPNLEK